MSEEDDFVIVTGESLLHSGNDTQDPFYYPSSNEGKAHILDTYSVQQWYPSFAALTFPTSFLSLSENDIRALLHSFSHPGEMQQIGLLENLAEEVEQLKLTTGCKHVFVRLGSISPKDAVFSMSKLKQALLERMEEGAVSPLDANQRLILFQDLAHNCLKVERFLALSNQQVETAEEALALLTSSSRVWSDLMNFLGSGLSTCIAVRAWREFEISEEFRAFVSDKGEITGIGQYYHFLNFGFPGGHEEKVKEVILRFFDQELKTKIEAHCPCIIDLVVQQTGEVTLLELNPWGRGTGAGLFNWDKDKEVLQGGPLEVRLRTEDREHFNDITLLPRSAHELLASVLEDLTHKV
jgi:hypothetical protein